jgi:hypothetical protein
VVSVSVKSRWWLAAGTGVAAVALAGAVVGPASAGESLNGGPVVASAPDTYPFQTTARTWSVVSLRSQSGSNFNLKTYDNGRWYASQLGDGVDFAVIDSNPGRHRLSARYSAEVTRRSGAGEYAVRFSEATETIPVPTNPVPQITANELGVMEGEGVRVFSVPMRAGQGFKVAFVPGGEVYLVGPTGSTVKRRNQVVADDLGGPQTEFHNGYLNACKAFVAPADGVYGLVLVANTLRFWPPSETHGWAFFPFAYDPAVDDPQHCPVFTE